MAIFFEICRDDPRSAQPARLRATAARRDGHPADPRIAFRPQAPSRPSRRGRGNARRPRACRRDRAPSRRRMAR